MSNFPIKFTLFNVLLILNNANYLLSMSVMNTEGRNFLDWLTYQPCKFVLLALLKSLEQVIEHHFFIIPNLSWDYFKKWSAFLWMFYLTNSNESLIILMFLEGFVVLSNFWISNTVSDKMAASSWLSNWFKLRKLRHKRKGKGQNVPYQHILEPKNF